MSTETRDFPVAVIASISTGILLCKFSEMHEAAEFLMGHPIWTHQFGDRTFHDEMRRMIAEQCPGMVTEAPGIDATNWKEFAAKLEADLGKMVTIRKGGALTAMLPIDGLPDHLKDTAIMIDTGKAS